MYRAVSGVGVEPSRVCSLAGERGIREATANEYDRHSTKGAGKRAVGGWGGMAP